MPHELYLTTPPLEQLLAVDDIDKLAESLSEVARHECVSAILFPGEVTLARQGDLAQLCRAVQSEDVAAIIQGTPSLLAEVEADGLHLESGPKAVKSARKALGEGYVLGAGGLRTRHDAMEAGEAGADYVAFGALGAPIQGAELSVISWWQLMMELPVVVFTGKEIELARHGADAGADFLAPDLELIGGQLTLQLDWDEVQEICAD